MLIGIVLFVLLKFPYEETRDIKAYCPCEQCCGSWADVPADIRRTAGGSRPLSSGVAAPAGVELRGVVFVPGFGLAPIDDRAGRDYWEVRFHGPGAHKRALSWEKQKLVLLRWR